MRHDNCLFSKCNDTKKDKNGQLSCEVYRVSDTVDFVFSCFQNKNDANSIMKMVADEINEVKGNTKIKFIEGERVFRADQ